MSSRFYGAALLAITVGLATASCGGNASSLPANLANSAVSSAAGRPADTTSILKKLTKDVVIGSTVDPSNGDKAPNAITVVAHNYVLKEGQLLVCNFDNSSGKAGAGTTLEVLDPTAGSKPTRFTQSSDIEGCDGSAIAGNNSVYGSGLTSGDVEWFSVKGAPLKTYSTMKAPLNDAYAGPQGKYVPDYIFAGSNTGAVSNISVGSYGTGQALEVISGFPTDKSGPSGQLGPTGLQYNTSLDTLYVVDGANNAIYAVTHASYLLEQDEIVVESGGKTFKCKHPQTTCAHLVYSGSPLDAPMASALLPNGNLIAANTGGTANTLVELTPAGQILDTKVVDKSATQGVFGLAAIGTDDANTALFFTDTNSNNVQELEQ